MATSTSLPTSEAVTPAIVSITIDQFNSLMEPNAPKYAAVGVTMQPNAIVTLQTVGGMPTFTFKSAAKMEISILPSASGETYEPLGVYYKQLVNQQTTQFDPYGALNFVTIITPLNVIVIDNKSLFTKANGRYEFYILIRRMSDGQIGLIDPVVENSGEE